MSLGNFALFCSHAAGLGAQFQHLLLVLLVSCCHTADSAKTWPLMPLLWFAQVAASIAVPLWQNILLRIGKKATVFIGMSVRARAWAISAFSVFCPILTDLSFSQLFIPAVATVACFPSNLPVFMLMCILMGFSVATMFLLPWWVIFPAETQSSQSNPRLLSLAIRIKAECGAQWIIYVASAQPGQRWILNAMRHFVDIFSFDVRQPVACRLAGRCSQT